MQIIVSNHTSRSEWDEILYKACPEGGLLQSYYWAKVINSIDKGVPIFIRINNGSNVVAQALLMKRYPFNRIKKRKTFPLPYIACLDGPVILDTNNIGVITEMILRTTLSIAQKALCTHITFTPSHTSQLDKEGNVKSLYRKFGFTMKKWATYLVDLRYSEEELFKRIRHSARKCIKKSFNKGLNIVKMKTFQEYKTIYWDAYNRFEVHFGRRANPCFSVTWEEDNDGYYHYYVVQDSDKTLLACLGMYLFNGVATEIMSSISPVAYEKKLPAQDLLHWKMLLEAKRMGCHTFDLAGFNPDPQNPKELGIRRFKEKWGGEYVQYNVYHKDLMPRLNKFFEHMNSLRKRMRGHSNPSRS